MFTPDQQKEVLSILEQNNLPRLQEKVLKGESIEIDLLNIFKSMKKEDVPIDLDWVYSLYHHIEINHIPTHNLQNLN